MRQIGGVSTNRLLDVWETLLSFSKYFLSNTFSQNLDNLSVAFSLLFSIYPQRNRMDTVSEVSGLDLDCLPMLNIS